MASLADLWQQWRESGGYGEPSGDRTVSDRIDPQQLLEGAGYISPRFLNVADPQGFVNVRSGGAAPINDPNWGSLYSLAQWTPEMQQRLNTFGSLGKDRFSWDRLRPFAMMGTAMAGGYLAGETGAGAGLGEMGAELGYATEAESLAAANAAQGISPLTTAGATPAIGTPEWDIAQGYPPPADLPPQLPDWYGPDVLKTAGGAAGGSALSRLLGFGETGNDVLSVLGGVAPGVLGYLGAGQQSDAYRDVANQYLGLGAPYRGTLEASYQPGFDLSAQPGYGDAFNRMADISARQYGAKFGNPAGSPTAQAGILSDVWNQGYLPALASYRGQLGQFGGLGLNTAGAGSLGGAGVAGGQLDALGLGLSRLMTPKSPYEDWFNQMVKQGSPNYRTTY